MARPSQQPIGSVPDPLSALEWMANYHGVPFSRQGMAARVPDSINVSDIDDVVRMLDVLGMRAQEVRRPLGKLDPGTLPVLLPARDGGIFIVAGLDPQARIASIVDPKSDQAREVSFRDLSRLSGKSALLVTPKEATTASRLSPDALDITANRGHWLWSELRRHKGAWMQVVLAAFGVNLVGLALPIFVMNVFDRVIPNLAFVTLTTLAIGVFLALLLDLVLRLLRSAIIQKVSRRVDLAVASRLFQLALSQRLLSRRGGAAGAITNLRDFESVRDFFTSSTFIALIDLAFIGLFLAVLMYIVGPLAWIPLAAIPLMLTVSILAQIPISRSAREAQQMSIKRNVVLFESLSGLETVKSVGAEPVLLREWENAVAASSRVGAKTRNWSSFTSSATVLIQQAVSAGIICWGVFLVADGVVSIGALIAANILAGRILSPLAGITQTIFRANFAIWSIQSINAFVQTEIEQRETLRSDLQVREGRVELNDVSFSYPEAKLPALKSVSAQFGPGDITAVLGRIGSGKSTLGKLINGTYKPDGGIILIDGHEIAQFEPSVLRAGIGYLPQDPVLFTGTLRENITLGVPTASDDDIMRALYFAGIDEFVANLPEGLDFFAGEKGERLSGGQRQAISLARLLLRRPKFLFLDEPTNAMDHQSEALIIERLTELNATGVGMVLSTHRMSLAGIASRFVILEKGSVAMNGPREEVLTQLNRTASQQQARSS